MTVLATASISVCELIYRVTVWGDLRYLNCALSDLNIQSTPRRVSSEVSLPSILIEGQL